MRPPTYRGKKIIIEVEACDYWAERPADARRWEREIRDALDARVRDYLSVGPYSKTVKTRLETA